MALANMIVEEEEDLLGMRSGQHSSALSNLAIDDRCISMLAAIHRCRFGIMRQHFNSLVSECLSINKDATSVIVASQDVRKDVRLLRKGVLLNLQLCGSSPLLAVIDEARESTSSTNAWEESQLSLPCDF